MKKIHIGSKINLVEVPDKSHFEYGVNTLSYEFHENDYNKALQHAIDNPIAEFDKHELMLVFEKIYLGRSVVVTDLPEGQRLKLEEGLHDIPDGYGVEIKKEERLGASLSGNETTIWVKIASLVPIKEEMRDQMVTVLKQMGLDAVKVEDVN